MGSASQPPPQPEGKEATERVDYIFEVELGRYILEQEENGVVDLTKIDNEIYRRFFKAGWGWNKADLARAEQERDEARVTNTIQHTADPMLMERANVAEQRARDAERRLEQRSHVYHRLTHYEAKDIHPASWEQCVRDPCLGDRAFLAVQKRLAEPQEGQP